MSKTFSEILKIFLTILLSSSMTVVVLSGTVINRKADKKYVDDQDDKIKLEYKEADETLKEVFLNEIKEVKEMQKEIRTDIKELIKK